MLIGLMQFLVRFVEVKVKNGLTWFLICFSKKKYEIWTHVSFFLCNSALEKIKLGKLFESQF